MHASQFFISHPQGSPLRRGSRLAQADDRAGMIRKLAGGIYNYMPMGLRVIRKIEASSATK
jgi:prolyl-tRNA synthetase